MEGQKIELTGHPLYSIALAPNDFYLFLSVKNKLRGQLFSNHEEAVDAFKMHILEIPKSERKKAIKIVSAYAKVHETIMINNLKRRRGRRGGARTLSNGNLNIQFRRPPPGPRESSNLDDFSFPTEASVKLTAIVSDRRRGAARRIRGEAQPLCGAP
ncbi:hypothetical protein EVAR_100108_1 [Eumeta japonica]|uniref:Mariner Mos1 transposase n=1 Tax=Eumeta variegata TaxID=151549 RepID=A0A4C1YXS2_EUMVA|nr:hypothetical protein EVAR_100108_1 [Eumeta japonica]